MNAPQFFVTPGYGDKQLREAHYSQAVRVGDRIETSGQGGWDDHWNFPATLEDEIVQAFDNLARTLATAGASWPDVIHVNSYHVSAADGSFPAGHLDLMTREFRTRMEGRAPIWTALGVSALGDSSMRIEIRVTAVIEDQGRSK